MRRWLASRSFLHSEQLRFLVVGAVNTAVGYVLFVTFVLIAGDIVGYVGALYLSYAIAIAFAFILHRHFSFQKAGTERAASEFVRFVAVYVVALAVNTVLLPLLVELGGLVPLVAQAIVVVVTTVLSYVGHKWFSFAEWSNATRAGGFLERFNRAVDRAVSRPAVRNAAAVGIVLVVLELVVFHDQLTGVTVPPWDFFSGYNVEAYAWWHDGGLLAPPDWMPYTWGGYPAALNVQNSSWYLPVGIASLFGGFTIQASGVLAAVQVAFGSIGAYFLARSLRASASGALLVLIAWFFAPGFFANASMLDISRAYAWIPWLLLIASPAWKWDRAWRWVFGVLLIWQGILAVYPGIMVATAYLLVVWVVAHVIIRRGWRDYVLPLTMAGVLGAALSLLRFLPVLLTRGVDSPSAGDTSTFTLDLPGTLLYPYGATELTNDITMRSFFVGAAVLALLPLVPWGDIRARMLIVLGGAAALLSLPFWPWHHLVDGLPGMGVSRFVMSDFKPFLLLSFVLLAGLALTRLLAAAAERVRPGALAIAGAGWVGLICVFAVWGIRGNYPDIHWGPQFLLLVLACVVVAAAAFAQVRPRATLAIVATIAVASGILGVFATTAPWSQNREALERTYFAHTVSDLLERRVEAADLERRPSRTPATTPVTPLTAVSERALVGYYDGSLAVTGYVNLKGAQTWERIRDSVMGEPELARGAMTFWAAGGLLIEADGDGLPAQDETQRCDREQLCGAAISSESAVGYHPGRLTYDLRVSAQVTVAANEAYYPGWSVVACGASGKCVDLGAFSGDGGELRFDVPQGDWTITMEYRQPGTIPAAIAATSAGAVTLLAAVLVEIRRRRTRRTPGAF